MLKRISLAFGLFFFCQEVFAQSAQQAGSPGGGKCAGCIQPADGSGSLGLIYRKDTCGLNYKVVSQKIGQRFTPPGPLQPVTMTISGLPLCAQIERAFLWCDASGTGIPITASITNPLSVTQAYPMTLTGSQPDKCWGFAGTHSYRADVTASVTGNGSYQFSGFPVGTSGDDVDGIAMMIIYEDPTVNFEGHIIIYDGAVEISGGNTLQTISNINACANSTMANSFMLVADLQNLGAVLTMNNGPNFSIIEDWWNYVDMPTTQITTTQTTSDFTVTSTGDCFNFLMMGLYYQTVSCNVCTANSTIPLNVSTTSTGGCGSSTGSVSATASGGTGPYSYLWQPTGDTTATVNNVSAGTYIVNVTDASGCAAGSDTITVVLGNYPVAQFSLTPQQALYPGQVCVTDQTVGATSWYWLVDGTPADTNSAFCYILPDTGTYCFRLIVANSGGCMDTTEQCITALGESFISVPNVFTPNADGSNDAFVVTWIGLTSLQCEIYDRWGVKIYEWNSLSGNWDGRTTSGKKATDGVYYYVIHATTVQNENKTLTGFVHLISAK
jgi:gliding motility-associated-like protein